MSMDLGAVRTPTGPEQGGRMGEARLADRPGAGTLQVWRGQRGETLEYAGTWRRGLERGADPADVEALEKARREGRTVRFEGRLDDPEQPRRKEVAVPVEIRSLGRYPYVLDPSDPSSPTVDVLLVNFRPVEEVGAG